MVGKIPYRFSLINLKHGANNLMVFIISQRRVDSCVPACVRVCVASAVVFVCVCACACVCVCAWSFYIVLVVCACAAAAVNLCPFPQTSPVITSWFAGNDL